MPGLENFMLQTAGQVAGTGMGLLLADENDRRQLRQQEKLQKLGIKGSKEMTDYSYKKQMEMWKNTNYGAQMEELAKAGLNPGLLYGMGGQGGMTTGKGAENVDQGKAPQGGGEAQGMGLMGAQMGLLAAQTEKTKAETQNITGQAANQPIIGENIQAQTGNTKAQQKLTEIETGIKEIASSVSRQTIYEQMRAWEQQIEKQDAEIHALWLQNDLTEAQMEDKKKLLKNQVASEAAKTALMGSEINRNGVLNKVSDAQWQNLIQQLWMDREYLSEQKMINTWNRWKVQNDIAGDDSPDMVIPIFGSLKDLFGGKPGAQPIRGFHNR